MTVVLLSSLACRLLVRFFFFFFNDTATTEIYTLSLHDALPICLRREVIASRCPVRPRGRHRVGCRDGDRKSTRLNSSHLVISYAVFCLKKKKKGKSEDIGSDSKWRSASRYDHCQNARLEVTGDG